MFQILIVDDDKNLKLTSKLARLLQQENINDIFVT